MFLKIHEITLIKTLGAAKILVALSLILTFSLDAFLAQAQTTNLTVTVISGTPSCGDGSCNGSETCSSCSTDCGICPSGGGGGGGGGYIPPIVTQVIFKGKAYPDSKVALLKDAQLAAQVPASPDANFEISLSGLSAGTYTFGVWAEDIKGNRSITHTFTISITAGATTVVSGIFIPPTISLDKSEVKRGEVLNILGFSAPTAEIAVFINSVQELVKKISAGSDGGWLYQFDTLEVDYGYHSTRSRATKDGSISTFSQTVVFQVGTKTVPSEPKKIIKGDLSGDDRVNLVDFSIAAYWHKRPLNAVFSQTEKERLNGDGKVDLIDFSIMAYYWTG